MKPRVLVIEDTVSQRRLLADFLRSNGCEVFEAWSVSSARLLLPSVKPRIVVLDLLLGDDDASKLVGEITAMGSAVLIISADGRVDTRVDCLSAGALDYMVKPLDLREFNLRIEKLGKLFQSGDNTAFEIDLGPMTVSLIERTIGSHDGKVVRLSDSEFSLLMIFLQSRGDILSRRHLSELLHFAEHVESRSIDVLVSKLRRKLQGIHQKRLIWSVRNEGYRMALDGLRIPDELQNAPHGSFETGRAGGMRDAVTA